MFSLIEAADRQDPCSNPGRVPMSEGFLISCPLPSQATYFQYSQLYALYGLKTPGIHSFIHSFINLLGTVEIQNYE